jgi:hypothetical protein
LSIDL